MSNTFPAWRGLFNWSTSYHDGTTPTDFSGVDFSPEKMAWMESVMKEYVVDFSKRMEEIQAKLSAASASDEALADDTLEESEKLLEELQDVVESIDFARDLHKIGGLPTLIALMGGAQPTLAWRAADVASTCCQNHIVVQQWFHDGGALPVETRMLAHDNAQVRGKGLHAISSLVRGYAPALQDFLSQQKGLPLVVAMAGDETPRNQRKALELLKYFCKQAPGLRPLLAGQGPLLGVLQSLLSSEDDCMMGVSLGILQEMADDRDALQLLQVRPGFVAELNKLQKRLQTLTGEDADAVREELEAAGALVGAFETPVSA